MTDERDPILDACLEELLGGSQPPNLTARILGAWQDLQARQQSGASSEAALSGAPLPPPIAGQPVQQPPDDPPVRIRTGPDGGGSPGSRSSAADPSLARRAVRRSTRSPWHAQRLGLAIAASLLIVGTAVGLLALRESPSPPVAGSPEADGRQPAVPRSADLAAGGPDRSPADRPPPGPSQPGPDGSQTPAATEATRPGPPQQQPGQPSQVAQSLPFAKQPADEPGGSGQPPRRPRPTPSPDAEIVAWVNQQIRQAWQEYGVRPSPPATDAEWCRRTYLRLLGRIPKVDELDRFVESRSSDKRTELVQQLLSSEPYVEQYARHWSTVWANVLIGRTGGTGADDPASREGLVQYLRIALQENIPYDRLAYELIAATGAAEPEAEDFNGATNFLLASLNDKATLATARTSRIFLGKDLQCTQCHRHPSNDWEQDRFWELNAFFRQMGLERDRPGGQVRLVNRDFLGDSGDSPEGEVYYEQLNGRMKVAYPRFVDGSELPHSGLVEEVDRRSELARHIAGSEHLSRAVVNRLWAHFLGHGFTRSVDDLGPHNPPSHPELFERLAVELTAHDYDLRRLMQWIVLSEPFGLSSKLAGDELADAPEAGGPPLFSRYYTRQMQPEEVYDSLMLVARAHQDSGALAGKEADRQAWLGQFSRRMATDEGEEIDTFQGGIRQKLILMNGPLMQQATRNEQGSLLHRVVHSKMTLDEKVEHLFLAAVARKPAPRELDVVHKLLAGHQGDPALALQDIWWALLNSNEFILDH